MGFEIVLSSYIICWIIVGLLIYKLFKLQIDSSVESDELNKNNFRNITIKRDAYYNKINDIRPKKLNFDGNLAIKKICRRCAQIYFVSYDYSSLEKLPISKYCDKCQLMNLNDHAYNYIFFMIKKGYSYKSAYHRLWMSSVWKKGKRTLWKIKYGTINCDEEVVCDRHENVITEYTSVLHHKKYNTKELFSLNDTEFVCKKCHREIHCEKKKFFFNRNPVIRTECNRCTEFCFVPYEYSDAGIPIPIYCSSCKEILDRKKRKTKKN